MVFVFGKKDLLKDDFLLFFIFFKWFILGKFFIYINKFDCFIVFWLLNFFVYVIIYLNIGYLFKK